MVSLIKKRKNIAMPKYYSITLKKSERNQIQKLLKQTKFNKGQKTRANIILKADKGKFGEAMSDKEIAKTENISARTVERTRRKCVEEGWEKAILGNKRGKNINPKITPEVKSYVLALSYGYPPKGYDKWSLRLLAQKVVEMKYVESISYETIRQILNAAN